MKNRIISIFLLVIIFFPTMANAWSRRYGYDYRYYGGGTMCYEDDGPRIKYERKDDGSSVVELGRRNVICVPNGYNRYYDDRWRDGGRYRFRRFRSYPRGW